MAEQERGRHKDNSRKHPYEWQKRQEAARAARPKQRWVWIDDQQLVGYWEKVNDDSSQATNPRSDTAV